MNSLTLRKLSYGVYIISTMDGERPTGCVANSSMQITSEPATVAVSVNHNNYTNQCIRKSGRFSLSILGEGIDSGIIGTFGFQSGKDTDKFAGVSYEMKDGVPVLTDACGYLSCEVVDSMETETHTIFLGKITDADELNREEPMTYAYYHRVVKGKSPKNAPTYIPEEEQAAEPEQAAEAKYICSVCGYIYDGDVPFEELPESYVCPICKQPKSVFVKK